MKTKKEFIGTLSKYINLDNYDIRFKKSRYYDENEMWLYAKNDEGELKQVIIGYTLNGKFYKTSKDLRKNFVSGYNDYKKVYDYRKRRTGFLITEETLKDEEYLKSYLESL